MSEWLADRTSVKKWFAVISPQAQRMWTCMWGMWSTVRSFLIRTYKAAALCKTNIDQLSCLVT